MRTIALLLMLTGPALAGWRSDCRHEWKVCRQAHGVTSTTTSTTTTTLAADCPVVTTASWDSQNCSAPVQGCVRVFVPGGPQAPVLLCPPLAVMAACSFAPLCPPSP